MVDSNYSGLLLPIYERGGVDAVLALIPHECSWIGSERLPTAKQCEICDRVAWLGDISSVAIRAQVFDVWSELQQRQQRTSFWHSLIGGAANIAGSFYPRLR